MKLKSCENCLMYGSDKKPLARARVVEVEEDVLKLYFGIPQLRNARLKTIVDFYDPQQGRVRCLCDIDLKKNPRAYESGEPWMADCVILKIYEAVQRQKDLRVKVRMVQEFVADDGRFITGTLYNISAGGMFMTTTQTLAKGQRISFQYRFKTETQKVTARVLRVEEVYGGYGYGCQFIGVAPDVEADLRNFVYMNQMQKQLERQQRSDIEDDML